VRIVQAGAVALAAALVFGAAHKAFAQDDAAALYKSKCQVCHGADGKGDTAAGKATATKDFHSPDVAKMTDTEMMTAIKNGKGKMTAYAKTLTDDQIKSLVKYVRSLK
jgi:cytochrome c6